MKKLWGYFRTYAQDFPWGLHLTWLVFLTAAIFSNYFAGAIFFNNPTQVENDILNPAIGNWRAYAGFFGLYGGGYLIAVLLQRLFRQDTSYLTDKWFWIKAFFFLAVLVVNASSSFYYDWLWNVDWLQPGTRYFAYKIVVNLGSVLLWMIPLAVFWLFVDRGRVNGFYGLARKGFIPAPYFILLAAMIPLIAWASFQADFLSVYPTFSASRPIELFIHLSPWASTVLYQVGYALDFIGVELLFRGALVIGLARVMGKEAILPMVTVYCFLHFGKPMGECISSIFGGYILGVIAFYGRNIWGGAIVHIGIALMMEWAAILQGA